MKRYQKPSIVLVYTRQHALSYSFSYVHTIHNYHYAQFFPPPLYLFDATISICVEFLAEIKANPVAATVETAVLTIMLLQSVRQRRRERVGCGNCCRTIRRTAWVIIAITTICIIIVAIGGDRR
jgi:hypothetical protein